LVNIHEPGPSEGYLAQWPVLASWGALEVRLAETEAEVDAAQRLRYRIFYEEMNALPTPAMRAERRDFDRFDDFCDHLLVVDRETLDDEGQPQVVATYRMTRDIDARRAGGFYTAGEFDIAPLLSSVARGAKILELGRSCVLKSYRAKPAAMQLLWKGLAVYNERFSIELMFGCASFNGTDPDALALPLSYLHHFHAMPPNIPVRALPALAVDMNRMPRDAIDPKEALRALSPLIKGYVRAGALIGDGAVIDRQFSTIDVFIYLPLSSMRASYQSRFRL
jgi:putative hemolysin